MKVFYHSSDLDGRCSAALVKLKHPDCELIGIDYGDEFPMDVFWDEEKGEPVRNQDVWMVDFCLQPFGKMWDVEVIVNKLGGNFFWIDHHKTAIDEALASGFEARTPGLRRVGQAACELTWEYLCPGTTIPEAVWLLGRYDVWDLEADPSIVPFQYGMRLRDADPNDYAWWRNVVSDSLEGQRYRQMLISDGEIIQQSIEQGHKATAEYGCFEILWEGLYWIAINGPYRGSGVFKSVWDPELHHGMLSYFWDGKQWRFGLYTDRKDIDVSEIAKRYGGGGHKGAAGFQIGAFPFISEVGKLIGLVAVGDDKQ